MTATIVKTINEFNKVFTDNYSDDYSLVSLVKSMNNCVTVIHKECNTNITFYPRYIKYLHCTKCNSYGRQISDNEFRDKASKLRGDKYIVISSYLRWNVPIEVYCKTCGNYFPSIPNNFLRGSGCPECKKRSLSIQHITPYEEAEEIVESKSDGDYKIIRDSYKGTNSLATFYHYSCNRTFTTKPNNFICNDSRCPLCYLEDKQSRGESYIQKLLDDNNIKYIYPKSFNELRCHYPLRYDFYVPKLNLLIEYQGGQHYKPVNVFGGEERFEVQKEHDYMKYKYANDNGYNLLLIPYMVDSYEKIKNFINSYFHVMYNLDFI